MADLTNLTSQVDRTVALQTQAITVIQTSGTDQGQVDALTGRLQSSNDQLQAVLPPPTTTAR